MTDKHDKLVEMARECGFSLVTNEGYQPTPAKLAAFRDGIVASLCADVEPFVFEEYPYHYEAMGCGLEDRNITDRYEAMAYGWERAMERAAEAIPDDLYPASTVAALKAGRDAALARVAELEKDAARLEFVCNSPNRMVERESGLWRVYEDVAPADHPTAVWQGMTPRWHVTPREAIDAAITAALTKGQP